MTVGSPTDALDPPERVVLETPSRGARVDRFVVTAQRPQGRHVSVLQARDRDGSFVALKLATTSIGAELVDREARLLQTVDAEPGPALRLVGAGNTCGCPFIATSWLHGAGVRMVATEMREQGPPGEAVGLCCRIVQAYAELHARGIVHGQVHPRHVLVDGDGSVRLLDFSLAASGRDVPPAARVAARFHSLSAPEQAEALLNGEHLPLTAAAEQYSVAALLYLLITGRMYARLELERRALARDIMSSAPLPFADQGFTPWPKLEAVLGRALSKHPDARYVSTRGLQQALQALAKTAQARGSPVVASVQAPHSAILDDFWRDVSSEEALVSLAAPTCSVNFGAAGVAFALIRLGKLTGNPAAFERAERWLSSAERRRADADAFEDGDELTSEVVGTVSPLHNASGVVAVRAFLSQATGDHARQQAALDEFRAATKGPCAQLDLTLGRSSVLLFATLLYAGADRRWPATQRLESYADELCRGIWRDLANTSMTYFGIAHGWAGLAYATMMWAQARGKEPPPEVRGVLDMLAGVAEPHERGSRWPLTPPDGHAGAEYWPGWCHGNAGYVFLWNLAHAVYPEGAFAELAERAAWLLDYRLGVGNLCCGRAGQAYAALNHYRNTGEERWRARAIQIAGRQSTPDAEVHDTQTPLSLYKGQTALALLAIELDCPERAAMPLFEFEPEPGAGLASLAKA
jgi:eukaryotic-like serine/threonine-protein kinase